MATAPDLEQTSISNNTVGPLTHFLSSSPFELPVISNPSIWNISYQVHLLNYPLSRTPVSGTFPIKFTFWTTRYLEPQYLEHFLSSSPFELPVISNPSIWNISYQVHLLNYPLSRTPVSGTFPIKFTFWTTRYLEPQYLEHFLSSSPFELPVISNPSIWNISYQVHHLNYPLSRTPVSGTFPIKFTFWTTRYLEPQYLEHFLSSSPFELPVISNPSIWNISYQVHLLNYPLSRTPVSGTFPIKFTFWTTRYLEPQYLEHFLSSSPFELPVISNPSIWNISYQVHLLNYPLSRTPVSGTFPIKFTFWTTRYLEPQYLEHFLSSSPFELPVISNPSIWNISYQVHLLNYPLSRTPVSGTFPIKFTFWTTRYLEPQYLEHFLSSSPFELPVISNPSIWNISCQVHLLNYPLSRTPVSGTFPIKFTFWTTRYLEPQYLEHFLSSSPFELPVISNPSIWNISYQVHLLNYPLSRTPVSGTFPVKFTFWTTRYLEPQYLEHFLSSSPFELPVISNPSIWNISCQVHLLNYPLSRTPVSGTFPVKFTFWTTRYLEPQYLEHFLSSSPFELPVISNPSIWNISYQVHLLNYPLSRTPVSGTFPVKFTFWTTRYLEPQYLEHFLSSSPFELPVISNPSIWNISYQVHLLNYPLSRTPVSGTFPIKFTFWTTRYLEPQYLEHFLSSSPFELPVISNPSIWNISCQVHLLNYPLSRTPVSGTFPIKFTFWTTRYLEPQYLEHFLSSSPFELPVISNPSIWNISLSRTKL